MIPSIGAAFSTGASERQVLEMQGGKILLNLACAERFFAEAFAGAMFEGGGEQVARESPGRSPGGCEELIHQWLAAGEPAGASGTRPVQSILWCAIHTMRAGPSDAYYILQR